MLVLEGVLFQITVDQTLLLLPEVSPILLRVISMVVRVATPFGVLVSHFFLSSLVGSDKGAVVSA